MIQLDTTCVGKLRLFWSGPNVFDREAIDAVPYDLAGVYVLSAFTPMRPTLVPFYVGQSSQLGRRLLEHRYGGQSFARHLRSQLSTYFCVAVVSDRAIRLAAEAALIRHLRPAGNDQIPCAPAIAVNSPPISLLDD
jgi:hypothetical protein